MTKHDAGDVAEPDGLIISAEMIDEGVRVYLEHCPDTGLGDRLDRVMVKEIFLAMAALSFKPILLDTATKAVDGRISFDYLEYRDG